MTNKKTFLNHLHQAKVEHTRWIGMIKLLSAGLLDTNKEKLELNISEIPFGKWFYQEAMIFRDTTSVDAINEIETLWMGIHNHFIQIYDICVSKNKSNIFGRKKPLSEGAIRISAVHYQEMITLSDNLKQKLRFFEKQLNAKGEDEFDSYGSYLVANENKKNQESAEIVRQNNSKNVVSGARGAYVTL